MSSYSEFKSDVKGLATGIVVMLLLTLAFQITFLVIAIVVSVLVILIARLLFGKNENRDYRIKLTVIWTMMVIIMFYITYWFTVKMGKKFKTGPDKPSATDKAIVERYQTPAERKAVEYWENRPPLNDYKP